MIGRNSVAARVARATAAPLSRLATAGPFLKITAQLEAYLAFLQGKGSCGCGSCWEVGPEVAAACRLIHRPEPVVLDIGANDGDWSALLRKQFPGATLFLFEPLPGCRATLERREELSGVTVIPSALGREPGRAAFHSYPDAPTGSSLLDRRDSFFRDHEKEIIEVEVTTIDRFLDERKIRFVDFMKLDIEGAELDALKGAKHSLEAKRIGALSFEFGMTDIDGRSFFRDFWERLDGAGYRLWRITPAEKLVPVEHYYEDLEYFRAVSNYFAELRDHPYRAASDALRR